MPTRAPRPCAVPGCPHLTTQRYCIQHMHLARQADRERGSAAARGYDANWRRVRERVLREEPLCALCLEDNKVAESVDVHHIDGNPRNLERSNLVGCCHHHHSQITTKNRTALALLQRALARRGGGIKS